MSSAISARLLEFLEFPYSSDVFGDLLVEPLVVIFPLRYFREHFLLPSVCLLCVCVGHHDGLECGVMDFVASLRRDSMKREEETCACCHLQCSRCPSGPHLPSMYSLRLIFVIGWMWCHGVLPSGSLQVFLTVTVLKRLRYQYS